MEDRPEPCPTDVATERVRAECDRGQVRLPVLVDRPIDPVKLPAAALAGAVDGV